MDISVIAEQTAEGWVLRTNDDAKDILAGPVQTHEDISKLAVELGVRVHVDAPIRATQQARTHPERIKIRDLPIDTLFRIDKMWYRKRISSGKDYILDIVGTADSTLMSGRTEVTEVSVLNKK